MDEPCAFRRTPVHFAFSSLGCGVAVIQVTMPHISFQFPTHDSSEAADAICFLMPACARSARLSCRGGIAVTRLMGSLLFGIGPADPLTLSLMAMILMMVALIASYIPAWRAAEVDPMAALRDQ